MASMPGIASPLPEDNSTVDQPVDFKPDMAKTDQPDPSANPFSQYLGDTDQATRLESAPTSLWDRFKGHFQNVQRNYGSEGFIELSKIQDAEQTRAISDLPEAEKVPGGKSLYQQSPEDAKATADYMRENAAERQFNYDRIDASKTPLDYAAAVGGDVAGFLADPFNIVGGEIASGIKVGTTGWRMGSPVLAKVLDAGVSNAAFNVATDTAMQLEQKRAGVREELDWKGIMEDAGTSFLMGAPFGYLHGTAYRDELQKQAGIEPDPTADWQHTSASEEFLNQPTYEPEPATPTQSTAESVTSAHNSEDLAKAQEQLFGEVIGTRNLTPEQLNQVDDLLNAGKPYQPVASDQHGTGPETQAAQGENLPVREPVQGEGQPLPDVSQPGQQEGGGGAGNAAPELGGTPLPEALSHYENFSPSDLKVDAGRFQYKGGGDNEGVIDTLKKVKEWDQNKAGTVIVWQDKEGRNFVVDGHQRYGLAKRLEGEGQKPQIHALVWKEADGITADEAKVMAADINISQGSGTAIDAAKILRSRPEMLANLPDNAVTTHAKGLQKLSDDAFGMVVNGKVPAEYASIAGNLAPNPETHAQILDVLAKNEPASAAQAESMVRDVLSAPEVEQTMTDMFGSAQTTQILFKERAQVLSSAATALRKDRAAFNTLVKEEARLSGAGNKLATKTNQERAMNDAEILATLQATARRKGPVSDALAIAAKDLSDGKPRQTVVKDFLDNIRTAIGKTEGDGKGVSAPPFKGYINTREAGRRFHGSPGAIAAPDDFHYGTMNYYGNGLYSTSAFDVADGYAKRGKASDPHYYEIHEKGPVNSFNLAQPVPDWLVADELKNADHSDSAELVAMVMDEKPKSVQELYDEIRAESRSHGLSADSVQEIFQSFADRFQKQGFNAIDHLGGKLTKSPEHNVRIYFEPSKQVDMKEVSPAQFKAATEESRQPIAASLEQRRTETPAFKRWFGDSKIVDQHGEPVVMYHGTSKRFPKVDMKKGAQGVFWMTSDKSAIERGEVGAQGKGHIEEMYARIENPAGWKEYDKFSLDELEARGYDGVVLPDKDGTFNAIIFDPHQVKSIYNRGTFDREDARLAFSAGRGSDMFADRTQRDIKALDQTQFTSIPAHKMEDGRGYRIKKEGAGYIAMRMPDAPGVPPRYFRPEGGQTWTSERAIQEVQMQARDNKAASGGTFDFGAEGKPQAVLPGAERISDKQLAERQGQGPLKSGKTQKGLDFGLFGSGKDQMDLGDLTNRQDTLFSVAQDRDYLDFRPTGGAQHANINGVDFNYVPRQGEVEIVSMRTPTEMRRTGLATIALEQFLQKADNDNLAVRISARPLDRSTEGAGVEKLLKRFGFKKSGRVSEEMIRTGPTKTEQNIRELDNSLQDLKDKVSSGAPIDELANHPFVDGAVRQMNALPLTETQPGFMSDAWKAGRTYDFNGRQVVGYDNAINDLVKEAEGFSTKGPVRKERHATVVLGPPAAGKSGFAERFATERHAAIVDPDEAKKVIPEFNRGIGSNAVHEESSIMGTDVLDKFLDQGTNIVLPKVGHNPEGIRRLILNLKANGYKVDLVGVNVSYENAFRRMIGRFVKTGRLVNPDYLAMVGEKPNETYHKLREQGVADRYAEIDGNGRAEETPQILDSTGAEDGIPGLGGGGQPGDGSNVREARGPGQTEAGDVAFSAKRPQTQNMPTNRLQGGVAGAAQKATQSAEKLSDISQVLRDVTGAPIRQGRLGRAPAGKVAGQYGLKSGVIRLRHMEDFETQAHETAHSLETYWGKDLQAIKDTHKGELVPMAYTGAAKGSELSEGFAEWFRYYVTTPNYAQKNAPGFTAAFEQMMAKDPGQFAKIQNAQQRYLAWTKAPSAAVVASDVVSNKRGNMISDAVKEAGGAKAAIGVFASKAYEATIDGKSAINRGLDELAKVYEANHGKALDLKTSEDPYRLARMMQGAYSAGHIDLMHGIVPYRGVVSEGPSLADALTAALGSQWHGWDQAGMEDFAAYLISRTSIERYQRFLAGDVPMPPGKFTLGDYEQAVKDLETMHPNFKQAAGMVYEYTNNLLKKEYEGNLWTEEAYRKNAATPDYVSLMRDMSDLDRVDVGGKPGTLRQSIAKAYKGSLRSVINPLESLVDRTYKSNAMIKQNDVFLALDSVAQRAGVGSGKIVERIPATEMKASGVNVMDTLQKAAKEAGLDPQDAAQLIQMADDLFDKDQKATVFRPGEINEKGEPIIYVWKNGKKIPLRLADGELGHAMYNALTGMNKEARNLFINVLALPSTALRYGITTAPPFVFANYIRDQISAWVLTREGFIPFVSGAKGAFDELTGAEVARIYNSAGGIMGGANVAALDKARVKRDIDALNKTGFHIKRFASIHGFAHLTEFSETGTRLGVFSNAFRRAKRAGLTDFEAATEAAYQARDLIDFDRNGSQMHTARRLVTFLNASIQGLDKAYRVLTGEGSIKKAIAPYINAANKRPLGARDKENMAKSASAWVKLTAMGVFGVGLSALYRNDPDHEEISDYLKATHWMVKAGPGKWWAIPKPFELGFVSNLFERTFDSVYGRNPIAMHSFLTDLYNITAPPTEISLFKNYYELAHGKDDMGRDIVPDQEKGYEPWRQYTANTSELAKAMGRAVNVSPMMIDHAIQGFGASWGKILTDASDMKAQDKTPTEALEGTITNRFLRDETKGSTSSLQFWDLISQSTGTMAQAANTYKDLVENTSQQVADQMLAPKDDNTKALAIANAFFKADVKRLNPMIRAQDSILVINSLRRDMADRNIKSVEDEDTKIELNPTQRKMAQDLLSRVSMIEARNALIVLGVPGWAQKKVMETESLYKDLASTSPELADELQARMAKKKVYSFDDVRENWPEVKQRLLTDGQDADFSDITSGMDTGG